MKGLILGASLRAKLNDIQNAAGAANDPDWLWALECALYEIMIVIAHRQRELP